VTKITSTVNDFFKIIKSTTSLSISSPVMDVASGEYGDVIPQLTSIVKNGRLFYNQNSASSLLAIPSHNSEGNTLKTFICQIYSSTKDTLYNHKTNLKTN
jgi:hypothetical protein